jgi:MFS family permease
MTRRVAGLSREFRLLAAGQAFSWLGDGFQTVALAVAVVVSGGGVSGLGLVMASSILARLICTLAGGVWADRLQPQRVMIGADLVRCAAAVGMAAMFASGHNWLPLLCALAAVMGGGGACFFPAMSSLKPMLVAADERQSANALLSMLQTGCSVVGPAAGGLVVASFGAPAGFAANAATYLVSVGTVALVRTHVGRSERRGMLLEIGEGWQEIRSRDWLLSGVLAATVYHVANGVLLVLVQVIAVQRLGGAGAVGVISAAEGLGGLAGAAIALRVRPRYPLRAGWFALLLMPVWAISYVWPGVLAAVLFGAVLGYAGLLFFSVAWETALQDHVPHRVLARVSSWDILTSFIGMPIGNALAGPLANTFGLNRVMVVCAAVLLGAAIAPLLLAGTRALTRPVAPPAAVAAEAVSVGAADSAS